MAVDMFLKIDTIKGETVDKTFVKGAAMDILAWSWGVSNSGTTHQGGGGGGGKSSFQDISVTKYIDSASHALLGACATGEHFKTASLHIRKAGKVQVEYITIEMKEVLVTSVSTGGSGGEDRLTENISLNFAEVKFTYKPQKPDGSLGDALPFTYKIAEQSV
ncbi:MAG: type VI secretion system tube protein Hcp [Leptothrix sp. (in: Bacteria)]|nr:type VI secretion system tube protein Hcp [Leptothrix sp. (in: b-proteobacteria)]